MAENTNDPLFQEIEEDIRAERYAKLWQRYGKFAIAGLVALVVVVAGYQGWQSYDLKIRSEQSDKFAAAEKLLVEKKPINAQKAFASLAAEARDGYRLVAKIRQASLMAENGDKSGAQKVYDSVAADNGLDQLYRDLATLLSVLVSLDTGDAAALRAKLKPIMADDNPWRFSAKEAFALLNLRSGDRKQAYDLLNALSKDAAAPQGVRARAAELSAASKP